MWHAPRSRIPCISYRPDAHGSPDGSTTKPEDAGDLPEGVGHYTAAMKCTLIVHHTASARALHSVLKTVSRQRFRQFETAVVDDSDSVHGEDAVREFIALNPALPMQHVRGVPGSADVALAMARGAARATTDYLIFVPSATLLHDAFIATHMAWRGDNRVLVGNRGAALRPAFVRDLLARRVGYRPDWGWVVRHALRGELDNPRQGVVVRSAWLRRWLVGRGDPAELGHLSLTLADWQRIADHDAAIGAPSDPFRLGPRLGEFDLTPVDLSGLAVTLRLTFADEVTAAAAPTRLRFRAKRKDKHKDEHHGRPSLQESTA